mmetsp:Transcript_12779/g.26955  ORF Transcript_12779/g.26955 Transcript_12779/m.26955 type:complete len:249 (+) Transcript_12779:1140-1886(+)
MPLLPPGVTIAAPFILTPPVLRARNHSCICRSIVDWPLMLSSILLAEVHSLWRVLASDSVCSWIVSTVLSRALNISEVHCSLRRKKSSISISLPCPALESCCWPLFSCSPRMSLLRVDSCSLMSLTSVSTRSLSASAAIVACSLGASRVAWNVSKHFISISCTASLDASERGLCSCIPVGASGVRGMAAAGTGAPPAIDKGSRCEGSIALLRRDLVSKSIDGASSGTAWLGSPGTMYVFRGLRAVSYT